MRQDVARSSVGRGCCGHAGCGSREFDHRAISRGIVIALGVRSDGFEYGGKPPERCTRDFGEGQLWVGLSLPIIPSEAFYAASRRS